MCFGPPLLFINTTSAERLRQPLLIARPGCLFQRTTELHSRYISVIQSWYSVSQPISHLSCQSLCRGSKTVADQEISISRWPSCKAVTAIHSRQIWEARSAPCECQMALEAENKAQIIKTNFSRIPRRSSRMTLPKTTTPQDQSAKPVNIHVTTSSRTSKTGLMPPPPLTPQPVYKQFHLGMFEVGRPLGKGKFAQVYLVRERASGHICALKTLYKSEFQQYQLERQV